MVSKVPAGTVVPSFWLREILARSSRVFPESRRARLKQETRSRAFARLQCAAIRNHVPVSALHVALCVRSSEREGDGGCLSRLTALRFQHPAVATAVSEKGKSRSAYTVHRSALPASHMAKRRRDRS